MNISTDTISVLKNFSDINQNILVKTGNKIQTISTMKNILAEAEITEKFDSEFAIYDLPEFLRAVELFEKPALKFNGGSNVTIADDNSKQAIKYFFADKSVIVAPTKAINMPDQYVTFTLKKDHFAKVQKAITTLNLPDVAVTGDGKSIKLTATDKKNKSSNDYSINIGETDKKFSAYFKAENLKIIGDDYNVEISQQKISHFVNRNKPVQYWIALQLIRSFSMSEVYKLEDGTEYKSDDYIKVETREYHQTTHYLNRQIAVSDIIEEFGDLPTFEKGLYFDWSTYQNASDEDKELADKVQTFVDEHDYDREEDCWTMNKGGYDVDSEIVKKFTIESK